MHTITLQILYDDILPKQIGNLKRNNRPLIFKDIDGKELALPTLVFPFRRALYLVSRKAYDDALRSTRPHACASNSCPSEETWASMLHTVSTESIGFSDRLYFLSYGGSDTTA